MAATPTRPARDAIPIGPFLHYLMAECGVSPNTLAAYRSDLMRFIRWRRVAAPGPLASLDVPTLSGYVESLNQSGLAPSSVCRHLASLSTFFRFLVFEGRLTDNVAKLLVAPAVWDRLPTVLGPAAVDAAARGAECRHAPGPSRPRGPGDVLRDRLPGLGGRRTPTVDLDLSVGPGPLRRQGEQGAAGPARLPGRSPRSRSISQRDRPSWSPASPRQRTRVRLEVGPPALADRPLADRQATCPRGRASRRRQPAHAPAQLRHPPARRRRRPPGRPGDARPRLDRHDPDLYPGRAEPAPRRSTPGSIRVQGSARPTDPAIRRSGRRRLGAGSSANRSSSFPWTTER